MPAVSTPDPLHLLREPRQAAALLNPERARLLGALVEPASAAGLARRLGLPRQRINYHLRELEKEGLVTLVEERRVGNCMERVVRASARSYLISPEVLGAVAADPSRIADRFSVSYLVALCARAIRELASLRDGADRAGKRLATLSLEAEIGFASAERRSAFGEELAECVARLVAKYHSDGAPGARRFRLFAGVHPIVPDPDARHESH
ncbi:MAG TPA: helix-turn-helix domain-containing protein [Gemmatimonadales bacterium]|nr:helix-turn-helix domain-containing protein [Gemmatimonadales bacterium]